MLQCCKTCERTFGIVAVRNSGTFFLLSRHYSLWLWSDPEIEITFPRQAGSQFVRDDVGNGAVYHRYQEMVSDGTCWLPEMWDETHCMAGDDTEDMYLQFPVKYSVPSCTIHVATNFLQPVFIQKCFAGHHFAKPVPFMLSAQTLSSCTCVQSCLLSVSPHHFILPLQSVSCCKFLFLISISEVTVARSVSFAFTWDYQVIVIIISLNFLFKTVYCYGLPSLSLGYSFLSLWSNYIYNILIKTYISSSQRMENHLIL